MSRPENSITNTADHSRLPPGQQLVAAGKWPIIGERQPADDHALGTIRVTGCVGRSISWTVAELAQLPQAQRVLDIHCVTRWSMLDVAVSGVLLSDLLAACQVLPSARFVSFISCSQRRHSTSLPLNEAIDVGTIIATRMGDQPIPLEHGGPLRNIVPGKYFYKSVKWLVEIELLAEDRLGYWEAESGYHNGADPWLEQRYMAPTLDKRLAAKLIDSRNFCGLDLRSIQAAGRQLAGLQAVGARLRDADFRQANLTNADFSSANLSNAHFEWADLRSANFQKADLEGANFCGADLRGADLTEASLFGCTFTDETNSAETNTVETQTAVEGAANRDADRLGRPSLAARIDQSSIIPRQLWSALTPAQFEYLKQCFELSPER